jgi:hypothetical protein
MTLQFCDQLKQKILEMFDSFDADKDGFLDEKEMKAAFASMVALSRLEISQWFLPDPASMNLCRAKW